MHNRDRWPNGRAFNHAGEGLVARYLTAATLVTRVCLFAPKGVMDDPVKIETFSSMDPQTPSEDLPDTLLSHEKLPLDLPDDMGSNPSTTDGLPAQVSIIYCKFKS
jgi:hypothetical protein